MNYEQELFERFRLIAPELSYDPKFIAAARKNGWISPAEAARLTAAAKSLPVPAARLTERELLQRTLTLMPETMSVTSVRFMQKAGLLGARTANLLRGSLAAAGSASPVLPRPEAIMARVESVYGPATAARWAESVGHRGAWSAKNLAVESARAAAAQRSVFGTFAVSADGVLSDRMLKNALRAGTLPGQTYDLLHELDRLGKLAGGAKIPLTDADDFGLISTGGRSAMSVWKRNGTAFRYESWAARAALLSDGALPPEVLDQLKKAGLITPRIHEISMPASKVLREARPRTLEAYHVGRKYRTVNVDGVGARATPIQIYAKATQRTDKDIQRILQAASKDAQKAAEAAAKSAKIGGKVTAAQQRLIVNSVNGKMQELWETTGHLTVFGQKEAAAAALNASDFLADKVYGGAAKDQRIRSVQAQARAGVDAFISREENMLPLSERVYSNLVLAQGKVQLEVQKALIRGLSARDLADNVAGLISPKVPGGISYAAMRLARTEINNAFHFSQIRYTRDMPWVEGYQWHLSGSHPTNQKNDPCPDMARRDHDGMGRGVYSKNRVPGKPHPQCLCFITNVTASEGEFERNLSRGSYDRYLSSSQEQAMGAPHAGIAPSRETAMDSATATFAAATGLNLP